MSFQATYEHILHVESFRNIDLYQQGLYYMRFYITLEDGRKVDYSQPYNYLEGRSQEKEKKVVRNRDNHCWAPALINDEISSFQTRTFMIRFQEEDVELNETCFFKMAVPAHPQYDHYVFTLYCELMCADIQKIGGPPSEEEDQLFKCVTVYQSRIRNSHNGVHEYMPILFDNHHFCIIHCTMHAMLLDFKFSLSAMQVQLALKESQNTKKGIFQGKTDPLAKTVVSIQPKSFIEFINKITSRFGKNECEWFFNSYVGQLRQQCLNTLEFVNRISKHFELKDLVLPPIPVYSYLENQTLTDTQYQRGPNLQITDVLDVRHLKNQPMIAELIERDIKSFAATLFQLNNVIIGFMIERPKDLRRYLQIDYQMKIKDRWGENYLREQIKCDDLSSFQKKSNNSLAQVAAQLRKKPCLLDCGLDIEDLDLLPADHLRPILYEEIHIKPHQSAFMRLGKQQSVSVKTVPVIVLVHGFQGNAFDMRLIKNNLQLLYPDSLYLCSRANEEQTDGHIGEMGRNLALEVRQFVQEWCQGINFKLIFIGHSLGGIIIRAALPLLQEYQNQMHTYISMSSPHLGYMYNSSKIVEAGNCLIMYPKGLWFLKRMRKSFSLQQLSMTDSEQIEDTFIYKLSKQPGFNWFQNIMFLSSQQDQYVPFESARVQKCPEAQSDQLKGKKYERMVDNLLGSLRTNEIHRIDVNFVLEDKVIDNMIGRSAHIQFLESNPFLKTLVYCTEGIFQ